MENNYGKIYWWILGIAALMLIPFIGNIHLFDWDEINFAECAREMLVSGNYFQPQINFQPFWEKPPLFIWFQALSMKLFGVNEFAVRLPNALIGLLTLITVMRVGDKISNTKDVGKYWALAFIGSVLPHLYFRSGIIDPLFNYFMFLGILYYGYAYAKRKKIGNFKYSTYQYILLSGFFIGLGILTKGPVAYLIPALVIGFEWLSRRFDDFIFFIKHFVLLSLMALLTTLIWFGPDIYFNGTWFLKTFVTYQIRLFSTPDAGHGGFIGYHFVVLLIGVFPVSFLALKSLGFKKEKQSPDQIFSKLMLITFWVVLILFSIVKSKIVHYSSLAYFPLTYFAAVAVVSEIKSKNHFANWIKVSILSLGILLGLIVTIVPYFGSHIELLMPLFAKDKFAQANIDANVQWQVWHGVAGLWLIFTVIYWYVKQKMETSLSYKFLFIGIGIFVWLTLSLYIKKIEGISQNAAIDFFKSKSTEDCYIIPLGYKSYAHLFYGKVKKHQNEKAYNSKWLLSGDIDKPTYIISKITRLHRLQKIEDGHEVYRKNGFVVYKREVNH